jgi:hypothetical protein
MSTYRLAQLLNAKYGLVSRAADLPNQVGLNVKRDIRNTYKQWIVGKDQSVMFWGQLGYKVADELAEVLSKFDDTQSRDLYNPETLFKTINRALKLTNTMKHDQENSLAEFKYKVISATKGMRHKDEAEYNTRESKAQTAIRHIDHRLEQCAKDMQEAFPELKQFALLGGYELQKPRVLSRNEIREFLKWNPIATKYGLDLMTMEYLVQSTGLMHFPEDKMAVEALIRAVKAGHKGPRIGPEVFQKAMAAKRHLAEDRLKKEKPPTVLDLPEEAGKRLLDSEILDPNQQLGQQLTDRKQEKALERQEDAAAEQEKQRIQPMVQQRDLEHQKRQEELKQKQVEEDRKRLIRSDGTSLLLDQLLKGTTYENI